MAYTSAQVAAMQYKKAGFKKKVRPVMEGKYFRFRQKDPKVFQKGSFRNIDIGKKGGTRAIIGRPHGMRTTRIQSVLIPRRDMMRR